MKTMLKAPISERLKLECDDLLSKFAFDFNLHHYSLGRRRRRLQRRQARTLLHLSPEPEPALSLELPSCYQKCSGEAENWMRVRP